MLPDDLQPLSNITNSHATRVDSSLSHIVDGLRVVHDGVSFQFVNEIPATTLLAGVCVLLAAGAAVFRRRLATLPFLALQALFFAATAFQARLAGPEALFPLLDVCRFFLLAVSHVALVVLTERQTCCSVLAMLLLNNIVQSAFLLTGSFALAPALLLLVVPLRLASRSPAVPTLAAFLAASLALVRPRATDPQAWSPVAGLAASAGALLLQLV